MVDADAPSLTALLADAFTLDKSILAGSPAHRKGVRGGRTQRLRHRQAATVRHHQSLCLMLGGGLWPAHDRQLWQPDPWHDLGVGLVFP
ncbi:hypothetical protein, partial [Nocardia sp. NPDC047038]|uniref:hypothetical protein n=1 Tax=Nocardia sp. NPDC047038 TaxID=3154338 RepID=UPI0033FC1775